MAAYNVDGFRDFIFQSSFLKRYKVKSALLKKLKTDDVQLLKFGFEWVKFFIWGIKSNYNHKSKNEILFFEINLNITFKLENKHFFIEMSKDNFFEKQ